MINNTASEGKAHKPPALLVPTDPRSPMPQDHSTSPSQPPPYPTSPGPIGAGDRHSPFCRSPGPDSKTCAHSTFSAWLSQIQRSSQSATPPGVGMSRQMAPSSASSRSVPTSPMSSGLSKTPHSIITGRNFSSSTLPRSCDHRVTRSCEQRMRSCEPQRQRSCDQQVRSCDQRAMRRAGTAPNTPQMQPRVDRNSEKSKCSQRHGLITDELNDSYMAHVVSAFEQSLSNMTNRLQHLTATAEAKDAELAELRATIDHLRKQSGLPAETFSPALRRQSSGAARDLGTPGSEGSSHMSRHMSTDSVSSLNSLSSACSGTSHQSSATDPTPGSADSKKAAKQQSKKKSWLRSSFSKAFSSNNGPSGGSKTGKAGKKSKTNGSMSDVEPDTTSMLSVPNSPLLVAPHAMSMPTTPVKSSSSAGALSGGSSGPDDSVLDLQQQLHEKDMKLTDIRLEALSSAAQLEQLREAMNRMKNEMSSLKADNSRLTKLVTSKGINPGSPTSPQPTDVAGDGANRLSLGDPSSLDLLLQSDSPGSREGRRITLSVALAVNSDAPRSPDQGPENLLIGAIAISGKTKWDMLDSLVKKVFKEHVMRVDPSSNMGLSGDSVYSYCVADIVRGLTQDDTSHTTPELLPVGYLVGDNTNISLTLKGTTHQGGCVDMLAFESLIPKPIMQRYVSLLMEHRRIILCGPSGTGKTYLAHRLAEYLMLRSGKEISPGSIATFNVDHKSSKELRQYLANIADQCEHSASDLPSVIILDNLHHVASLGEVFNGFLNVKFHMCPYIIGTMNQATCSSTNLQLHHNFRWVLCANHMEPVKGFLGRYLRRKAFHQEVQTSTRNPELQKVVDWIPKVWQHLNKFLETHSSSDVTIGPRLFLSCPMDVTSSQVWFTDLWNYSIVPYLLEAVREGIQLYGRRAPWEDPTHWVIDTYPWTNPNAATGSTPSADWPSLLRMRPEDVGYDSQGAAPSSGGAGSTGPSAGKASHQAGAAAQSDAEGDPLLNMLMRLQEAASYSSPHSQDSDNVSLDSHTGDNTSNSGGSSREGSQGVESTI